MIGYEIANGRASAFEFRFVGEKDDKKIYAFLVGRVIRSEALITLYVVLKCILDAIPRSGFGLIYVIEQVPYEIEKASLIKLLSERSLDEVAGLFSIHFDSTM